jgi:hypothetical protein
MYKLGQPIVLLNFNNNSLNDKLNYRLLGVKQVSVRLQNWRLRLITRRLAQRNFKLIRDMHFAYRKVKKLLTGKQLPVAV